MSTAPHRHRWVRHMQAAGTNDKSCECGAFKTEIVLSPDHPVRTGEPSEAMVDAAMRELVDQYDGGILPRPSVSAIVRAALTILRETT